jgi:hypothetical protein
MKQRRMPIDELREHPWRITLYGRRYRVLGDYHLIVQPFGRGDWQVQISHLQTRRVARSDRVYSTLEDAKQAAGAAAQRCIEHDWR